RLLDVLGLERLQHGLVIVAGLHVLGGLVAVPPLPAEDECEADDDPADQPGTVAAQPGQYAFALFVFVQQVVDCHGKAVLLPPAASGRAWNGLARRADTSRPAGRRAGRPSLDSRAVTRTGTRLRVSAGPARGNRQRIP